MAFILEKISEEDKERLGLPKMGNYRWAVDRSLKAFFMSSGGNGFGDQSFSATYFFDLKIGDNEIKIETKEKNTKSSNDEVKYDVTFDITKIVIPSKLVNEIDSIKNLILEAFKVWGRLGNPDLTKSITTNLPNDSEISFN